MKKKVNLSTYILFCSYLIIMLLAVSCANIVAPTGGTKDSTPPKVVKTEPENKSTNFKGNTIRLYFDEFVQLKDESRVILISPPPDKTPEARVKGKSVILTLPGTLKENTTYSVQFGTSIQDLNEANPLGNYTYVFSTGNGIDSLHIDGSVLKAEDLSIADKIMVCLYSSTDDSVIFKEKPRYISRTNEKGEFQLNYIAAGHYKMIALKDDNSDLLASLPAEEIAFPDSLVQPVFSAEIPKDTTKKDSISVPKIDAKALRLLLFKEKDSTLRFQKAYMEKPLQLILPFSQTVNNLIIHPIGSSAGLPTEWYVPEWSKNHDTLTCWILPSLKMDSLNFSITAAKKINDTIHLDLTRYGKGGKYRRDKDKATKLNATLNIASTITPEETLLLSFNSPLTEAKLDEVRLIRPKDTIAVKPVFTDSLKRHLSLQYNWEENTTYSLLFPKGILKNWTDQTNDSLVYRFGTKLLQDYGNMVFNFQASEPGQYILQLLDSKDKVIKETVIINAGSWKLNYLNPGKYRVKMIQDNNNNSHWDSGNYRFKIQPEKISFYPKTLEIRGNWDLEEYWKW